MKIAISVGELSGDRHAARLVSSLRLFFPQASFYGLAGPALREVGVHVIDDLTPYSTIGLLEPLFFLPRILRCYFRMVSFFKREKPDLFIAVDSQGFQMLLLPVAKRLGIPSVYYIAPQEWQWGTEKGGRKVVDLCSKILAIYPQEAAFYSKLGGDVSFVGHPVLDVVSKKASVVSNYQLFCEQHGLDPQKKILSVFPGSRVQEIKHIGSYLIEAACMCSSGSSSEFQVVVSVSIPQYRERILEMIGLLGLEKDVFLYESNAIDLIRHARFSFTKSGTITLEHAVLGTPCVVAYRFSKWTFWF